MNPDPLFNRWPNLTRWQVEQLIPELENRNELGAAVCVAVNQCRGQRSKDNIVRIRGVHADLDGVSQDQIDAIRQRLEPTIEVQSSGPLNCHFYWLLDEGEALSHEDATTMNAGLVGLGADIGAKDISRLLRLPGFKHMKNRSGNKAEADDRRDQGIRQLKLKLRCLRNSRLSVKKLIAIRLGKRLIRQHRPRIMTILRS